MNSFQTSPTSIRVPAPPSTWLVAESTDRPDPTPRKRTTYGSLLEPPFEATRTAYVPGVSDRMISSDPSPLRSEVASSVEQPL